MWVLSPGSVQATFCGRYARAVAATGQAVGSFVYGKSYLNNPAAVPIDPVALPLEDRAYTTTLHDGLFGVIADAIPDDWGRFVIDRFAGAQRTPVGYLLSSMEDRVGNLAFTSQREEPPVLPALPDLGVLEPALRVLSGLESERELPPELASIVRPNTAMGGARPKLTIQADGAQWLAKFPARRDSPDMPVARIEAAALELAARCGIDTVRARVVSVANQDILLVQRFDRTHVAGLGWCRDPYASARTVFHSSPEVQAYSYTGSYPRLARSLGRWSARPQQDRIALFRRMVFNCLVSNTDDHDRNHGFVGDDLSGQYRLAPAFDLVPLVHATRRRHQALGVGMEGSVATAHNILSDVQAFGLDEAQAQRIFSDVAEQVRAGWEPCLQAQGLSASAIRALARCIEALPEADEAPAPSGFKIPRPR